MSDEPKIVPPLSDDDLMSFGKFKGKRIGDIPAEYLDWWMGADNTVFTVRLYKYCMKNYKQIQEEVREKE